MLDDSITVYEDDYIKLEYIGIRSSKANKLIYYNVENKTGDTLGIYANSLSVDGIGLGELIGYNDIAPNTKEKVNYQFSSEIEDSKPSEISGAFTISDEAGNSIKGNYYDASFSKVNVSGLEIENETTEEVKENKRQVEDDKNVEETTKPAEAVEVTPETETQLQDSTTSFAIAGDQVVCEQLGITVSFKGVDDPAGKLQPNYIGVKFMVTNATGQDTKVMLKDCSINGCMVNILGAASITSGNSAIMVGKLSKDKLAEVGITKVNKIEGKIWVDNIGTTDLFSFTVQ